jgi:hypothetical protein
LNWTEIELLVGDIEISYGNASSTVKILFAFFVNDFKSLKSSAYKSQGAKIKMNKVKYLVMSEI